MDFRIDPPCIHLKVITPGENKTLGKDLTIRYAMHETPFGKAFIAITSKGICQLSFLDDSGWEAPLKSLQAKWPQADIHENTEATLPIIQKLFAPSVDKSRSEPISLHVSGTNFQVSVWQALLQMAPSELTSYSQIAAAIGKPKSARAVGQAVGANPVAFIIPCHRVIQKSGKLGGYHWGVSRKQAILAWESARQESD